MRGFVYGASILLGTAAMAQAPVASSAPAPATPAAGKKVSAAADPNKVICRSTPEIGSLVATKKMCMTRREWTQMNEDLRVRGPVGNCAGGAQGGSCGL